MNLCKSWVNAVALGCVISVLPVWAEAAGVSLPGVISKFECKKFGVQPKFSELMKQGTEGDIQDKAWSTDPFAMYPNANIAFFLASGGAVVKDGKMVCVMNARASSPTGYEAYYNLAAKSGRTFSAIDSRSGGVHVTVLNGRNFECDSAPASSIEDNAANKTAGFNLEVGTNVNLARQTTITRTSYMSCGYKVAEAQQVRLSKAVPAGHTCKVESSSESGAVFACVPSSVK